MSDERRHPATTGKGAMGAAYAERVEHYARRAALGLPLFDGLPPDWARP